MTISVEDSKLISIIMPLYNTEEFLVDTVKSVQNQTYKNFELIIIDDCSTDGSYLLAKNLANKDHRIKALRSATNFGGPAGPRNIGLKEAKGDYIAFLDSDDIWPINKLEIQLRIMFEQELDFSSGKKLNFEGKPPIRVITDSRYDCSDNSYLRLLIKNFVYTSTVMARSSLFLGKQFEESKDYRAVEDYKFWLKVHADNPELNSATISLPLMNYRLHGGSISKGKWGQAVKVLGILREENKKHRFWLFTVPLFFITYVVFSLWELGKQKTYYKYSMRQITSD